MTAATVSKAGLGEFGQQRHVLSFGFIEVIFLLSPEVNSLLNWGYFIFSDNVIPPASPTMNQEHYEKDFFPYTFHRDESVHGMWSRGP